MNDIILFEPQCFGFEHAFFNAALLSAAQLAYPESLVNFRGEFGHISEIRQVLQLRAAERAQVNWVETAIPDRFLSDKKRFLRDMRTCGELLLAAKKSNAKLIIICSVTKSFLLALKILMHVYRINIPTLAIVHGGCLSGLKNTGDLSALQRLTSMNSMLKLRHPKYLRLIALGNSIKTCLLETTSCRGDHWAVMDFPFLWPAESHSEETPPASGKITFGFFGVTKKGFDIFNRLANDVSSKHSNCEFVLVGFSNTKDSYSKYIVGMSDKPLDAVEYGKRAQSITYCIGSGDPEYYSLSASSSFLDAISYKKPGVYLKNPYIECYFNQMGDIGYLCDSYEELLATVNGLISNQPGERYRNQIANIRNNRKIFEPEAIAPKLQDIVMKIISKQ